MALVCLGLGCTQAAFACVPEGRSVAVERPMLDGPITLRGGDGTRYRLAGIVPSSSQPAAILHKTIAELLPLNEPVSLTVMGEPDRYRRLPVTLHQRGEDITLPLLRSGHLRLDPTARQHPCRNDLIKAETEAFMAGHHPVLLATDRGALLQATGKSVAVRGRVISVRSVQKVTYINFGRRDSGALTAVIRNKNRAALVRDGLDPDTLKGQEIVVLGKIISWRGPQIDIERAENIRIPATKTVQQTTK